MAGPMESAADGRTTSTIHHAKSPTKTAVCPIATSTTTTASDRQASRKPGMEVDRVQQIGPQVRAERRQGRRGKERASSEEREEAALVDTGGGEVERQRQDARGQHDRAWLVAP